MMPSFTPADSPKSSALTMSSLSSMTSRKIVEHPGEHRLGAEILLRDFACGLAMARIVGIDRFDGRDRLVERRHREQPFAQRQRTAEAGVLRYDRTSRREITRAA